ncbi:MAG TPA: carboxypeptidase-like regulatory domain-containing protein, partial [Paludibacter sp.]
MKTFRTWLICLALGFTTVIDAQSILVSGKILDSQTQQALVGVYVTVKNSPTATVSDAAGNYSLKTEIGKTLVFSYIGYMRKEMEVTGPKLDILLFADTKSLSECVTVGYGSNQA